MEWFKYIETTFWFGVAAVGFGILFNVPKRTLFSIFLLGAIGGLTKVAIVNIGYDAVLGSFVGAIMIGVLSHITSWWKVSPPIVFSIPASIPMVPGVSTYKMMAGILQLTMVKDLSEYNTILHNTIHNGITALFILLSLAVGAALPLLLVRKKSGKELQGIVKHKGE